MKKWKIYIVPHTHWDREWYFTKSTANAYMYFNIEKIYKEYKNNKNKFAKFVYDSQYSVVDDYLKISPKSEKKVLEMVKDDKLVVSPWYTQTDTFNLTGESIVRNMLTGIKESEKYGNYMKVAYMPDSFGFNSNLPQIFKKFGMKAFIHWRGVKTQQVENGILNQWEGIDGTKILSYNLFKYGYTCGGRFTYDLFREGYDKNNIKQNAKSILDSIKNDKKMHLMDDLKSTSVNTNNRILFPWGSDQMVYFENLKDVIEEMNALDDEHEWIVTSYEEFIDELVSEIKVEDLNVLTGELRFGQYSRVHKTINSSRYDIKKLSKNLEYLIYKIAEPLSLIYEKMGGEYPIELIQFSQRLLMECQAHDSVGGCNSDVTNNSVVERLNNATDNINSLITFIERQIAFKNKLSKNDLIIFNLEPRARKLNYKMNIYTRKNNFKILDNNNSEIKFDLINQNFIDSQKFKIENGFENLDKRNNYHEEDFFDSKVSFQTNEIEPLSFEVLKVVEINNEIAVNKSAKNFIENDFYKISVDKNFINVLDKKQNLLFENCIELQANKDVGDLYDYSPDTYEEEVLSEIKDLKIIESKDFLNPSLNLEIIYKLKNLNVNNQKINLLLTLREKNIDINIDLKNSCEDVRWRIIADTNIESEFSYYDTAFGTSKHKIGYSEELKVWKEESWNDYPVDIEAMESSCWLKNDKYSFGILSNCNNEYQVVGNKKSKLAVTLYRSVSFIGRNNLLYRPDRASGNSVFPMATPNGNLPDKNINIELSIHIGDTDQNYVALSKEWCIKNTYYQVQTINLFDKNGDIFMLPTSELKEYKKIISDINIDKDLIVSCFKKSYDLNKNIIRLYNPTNKTIKINLPSNFSEVNLAEINIENNRNEVKPNEIVTYSFV